jgi:hypothetical protein
MEAPLEGGREKVEREKWISSEDERIIDNVDERARGQLKPI